MRKLYGKSRGRSPARPAWDRTRPISVRILRLFDCPPAGVRDLHADDLDRTSAHLHRIALHARKPVADKICQHLGWEAVLNQHFDGAAARLCICQHFEGSALLRADHYNLLRKHSRRYQRRPAPAISPPALYGARAVASPPFTGSAALLLRPPHSTPPSSATSRQLVPALPPP